MFDTTLDATQQRINENNSCCCIRSATITSHCIENKKKKLLLENIDNFQFITFHKEATGDFLNFKPNELII